MRQVLELLMKCGFNLLRLMLFYGLTGTALHVGAAEYQFREPREQRYWVGVEGMPSPLVPGGSGDWIPARPLGSVSERQIWFGRRISLGLREWADLEVVLAGRPLRVIRTVAVRHYLVEAADAGTAVVLADALASDPAVALSVPVQRKMVRKTGVFGPAPNDTYFHRQWHLENRDAETGASVGPDLNVRAAWPVTRGDGVLIAVADDGMDLDHPDLAANATGSPHFNFVTREEDGNHRSPLHAHGTAVAGLAAAVGGNKRGVSGVAPGARLASWVIFTPQADGLVEDEVLMNMFQSYSNRVFVQNHSWANSGINQLGPSALEQIGVSNAVHFGRSGKGVVIVRAGGNGRDDGLNSNDDGYATSPWVVTVGAVRFDSRVATYSTPGANVLVAAPSGDRTGGQPNLFTTDRSGVVGYNNNAFTNDLADYAFDGSGFSGTSGASPQIAGVAALMLSANPNLAYRDVQQILLLSSRQTDRLDPDVHGNGAGLRVSHSTGFGVPDAGEAVRLAKRWRNRPPVAEVSAEKVLEMEIPDDALRLEVSGPAVPETLASIPATPGGWLHPDEATLRLPLEDAGVARVPILKDLGGKAVLMMRGENTFAEKAEHGANAGASFAVIYNNRDGDRRVLMAGVDFTRIPLVFIGQRHGRGLSDFLAAGGKAEARLSTEPAVVALSIEEKLSCEHILVTMDAEHPRRGDLRVTLVSPSGTRSVLQRINSDENPGPSEWTYLSTHHFYEPSAGTWKVEVTDEAAGSAGLLRWVKLRIRGVAMEDTDGDALDDRWERQYFGNLGQTLTGDFDGDGFNEAREQAMGSDPTRPEFEFQVAVAEWKPGVLRLSWPGLGRVLYEVRAATGVEGPFQSLTNVNGRFPETEWFSVPGGSGMGSYLIRRL